MMSELKNKLYDYREEPPEEVWDRVIKALHNVRNSATSPGRLRSRILFYSLTAAASLVIIFLGSHFFNRKKQGPPVASNSSAVTLPSRPDKDSIHMNQQILESIINSPEEKKEILADQSSLDKKYITVAGPEGQPVKISPKVATLILSANDEYPPKPVWSRKINKWQKIMLSSIVPPTPTNIIDLVKNTENVE